ncbi:unnamed protein product [Ambrosiozyma monospora]|uniref:Unnamed protein product n=1 Tax=Ambrosiozyma monospora TaxID=43982 RepID=A0ACB5U643_AMBMO|nr:unnamed protein product [Ambrosiozyma monospora]
MRLTWNSLKKDSENDSNSNGNTSAGTGTRGTGRRNIFNTSGTRQHAASASYISSRPSTADSGAATDYSIITMDESPVKYLQRVGFDDRLGNVSVWDFDDFNSFFSPDLLIDADSAIFKTVVVKSFSFDELESAEIGKWKWDVDGLIQTCIKCYSNEVKAYNIAKEYNETHPDEIIHVPKLIAHGIKQIPTGKLYYIALEHIDRHIPRNKEELMDGIIEVERLQRLGINHNDVHLGNYLHDGHHLYVIDFGDAPIVLLLTKFLTWWNITNSFCTLIIKKVMTGGLMNFQTLLICMLETYWIAIINCSCHMCM